MAYIGRRRAGVGGKHRAKPYEGRHNAETMPLGFSVSSITSRLFKERLGTRKYKAAKNQYKGGLKGLFF